MLYQKKESEKIEAPRKVELVKEDLKSIFASALDCTPPLRSTE